MSVTVERLRGIAVVEFLLLPCPRDMPDLVINLLDQIGHIVTDWEEDSPESDKYNRDPLIVFVQEKPSDLDDKQSYPWVLNQIRDRINQRLSYVGK